MIKQKTYEIMIHLWWEKQIRKITIISEDERVEMWFRNFGHVTLDERKTRDIFSGIIQGLMGVTEGEVPEVYATIYKGKGPRQKELVRNKKELLDLIKKSLTS
jgi:hypothetical protein